MRIIQSLFICLSSAWVIIFILFANVWGQCSFVFSIKMCVWTVEASCIHFTLLILLMIEWELILHFLLKTSKTLAFIRIVVYSLISELDDKAQNLSMLSQKYKKDAAYLNTKSFYMKVAAGCFVFAVFVLYFWVF